MLLPGMVGALARRSPFAFVASAALLWLLASGLAHAAPAAPGDLDGDRDVDLDDVAIFRGCSAGPAVPHAPTAGCADGDFDVDGDIDQDDFGVLQSCWSGAGREVEPSCFRARPRATTAAASGQEDDGTTSSGVGAAIVITLEGQDLSFPDAALTATVTRLPSKGVIVQYDGSPVVTVPAVVTDAARRVKLLVPPDDNGSPYETFDYTVTSAVDNATSAPATVTVTVTPVPDKPRSAMTGVPTTNEDTPMYLHLQGDDPDLHHEGDTLRYQVLFTTIRGRLYQVEPDNVTPGAEVNDGDYVLNANHLLYYVSPPNANGTPYETMTWLLRDAVNNTSGPLDLPINVLPVNDRPTVSSQTFTRYNNDTVTDVFITAQDLDMDVISINFGTLPARGTLYYQSIGNAVVAGQDYINGHFIYLPTFASDPCTDFFEGGDPYDSFTFTASDGQFSTPETTDTVRFLYRNTPPTATHLSLQLLENTPSIDVPIQATDADSDIIQVTLTRLPAHGAIRYMDRMITYTPTAIPTDFGLPVLEYVPNAGYSGTDSFDFVVSDTLDARQCTYTVSFSILRVNHAPILTPISMPVCSFDENWNLIAPAVINVSVTDDAAPDAVLRVTVTATAMSGNGGHLSLANTTGLQNVQMINPLQVRFEGTLSQISPALANGWVLYYADQNNMASSLRVEVEDHGATGNGPMMPLTGSRDLLVTYGGGPGLEN